MAAAAGRVLAEDAVARRTHPPHDVDAMDGYAVRHADIAASPAARRLRGGSGRDAAARAKARRGGPHLHRRGGARGRRSGRRPGKHARRGRPCDDPGSPAAGRNVREAGYDFAAGAMLLPAGTRLGGAALGLLAGARVDEVAVWRRPRVALLATGDELVPPSADPVGAQIIASTSSRAGRPVDGRGGRRSRHRPRRRRRDPRQGGSRSWRRSAADPGRRAS